MRISDTEHSSVILSQKSIFKNYILNKLFDIIILIYKR